MRIIDNSIDAYVLFVTDVVIQYTYRYIKIYSTYVTDITPFMDLYNKIMRSVVCYAYMGYGCLTLNLQNISYYLYNWYIIILNILNHKHMDTSI